MLTRPSPLIIGHRGASGYRPEHSRSAYELAVRLGADAVEPDLVATRDGVLVVRHENELSGTTDVARHPRFAGRRVTKRIDGAAVTGWFTEDFTWPELATLRVRERLPALRPENTGFDGREGILRLRDLLPLFDDASAALGRELLLVAELKHATYFDSIGLPLDELVAAELHGWAREHTLIVESFEQGVLDRLRERSLPGRRVYLLDREGAAADLRARFGSAAPGYADQLSDEGLAALAGSVDGISVSKALLVPDRGVVPDAAASALVDRAHRHGLDVFAWTLRPENRFLAKRHRTGSRPDRWGDWRAEFETIMRTGVDGVFADHPDLALEVRESLAGA